MKNTVNKKTLTGKQLLALVLSFMVMTMLMSFTGPDIQAAAKKPGKPTVSMSASPNTNTQKYDVTVSWTKAKNAKSYNVYKITGTTWKYWKKVKASQKKKYSDTSKYKLKKSGKKYKVYKKVPVYSCVKKGLTARAYKFTGEPNTTYKYAVRAYNGKKAGDYSAIKVLATGKKPTKPTPTVITPGAVPWVRTAADEVGKGVSVSWGDAYNAETYEVGIAPLGSAAYAACGTTSGTNMHLDVSNYDFDYVIRVCSVSIDGTKGKAVTSSFRSGKDPATVPPATPTAKVTVDGKTITVQWNKTDRAINYEVYYRAEGEEFSSWKVTDKLGIKATDRFEYSTKYYFKVRAINNVGPGSFSNVVSCTTEKDPATLAPGEYSSNPSAAYSQFEAKMLNYYNEELARRGVSIDSTNKEDEFQKLQAIIQVVHDRMGLSEKLANDYTNFPTGRENWYYGNAYSNTNGQYYNGTDYCPTIEFYGSCDTVADIEATLAEKAGLNARLLTDRGGHVFLIIQANYVWYDADAWVYMYPGCNGISYGGCVNPSTFTEEQYDITYNLSIGTGQITNGFSLDSVFYGTSNAITSDNGLLFGNVLGILADQATYSSSDESVISFDNEAGTYTLHKTGTAYVTIVYRNVKPGSYQSQFPTYTTTISIKVK